MFVVDLQNGLQLCQVELLKVADFMPDDRLATRDVWFVK